MKDQKGHIDNSLIPVIVAILLLIIFWDQLVQWLGPWWQAVSGWDIFICATIWFVAIGLLVFTSSTTYQCSSESGGERLCVEETHTVYRLPALIIGIGMGFFTAIYFSLWLLFIAIPFALICLGLGLRLKSPVVVVTRSSDETLVDRPGLDQPLSIPVAVSPLAIKERWQGGAFGKALTHEYDLSLGPELILTCNSKREAEQIGGFISGFLDISLQFNSYDGQADRDQG